MSSRALRKAQREREEQERLKQRQDVEDSGNEVDDVPSPPAKKSAFAMLGDIEDEADDDDEHSAEQKEVPESPESKPATQPKASSKKKTKKKKGKNPAPPVQEPGEQLDEIDKALKQLSTNGKKSSGATTSGISPTVDEISDILAIDTKHLHAQNEMQRLFGRAALEQEEDEQPAAQPAGGNRRQQRRAQQVGLAQAIRGSQLAAMALRRNIFVQGKEDWPRATSGGLGMEIEEKRADGTILYRFVHSSGYQNIQSQFSAAVASMDPNRLKTMLQYNPYHVATLLQVSEIAKHDRNHTLAGDLLERALFSCGRSVHSTFAKTLAAGKARLDFRRPENRELWLAGWRYMQNLSMRGTWRTVYEWAKLLLSLSPEEDPYAMWLVLDQYALRARQDLDYLNISRNAAMKDVHKNMPNVQISQGLAEFRGGNKGKGKQALFTAFGRFPWVVASLMHELGVDAPPAIWGQESRTEREKLDTALYATRAKDLWNTPENTELLLEIASALTTDTPAAELNEREIDMNTARHVLQSENPALMAFIPKEYKIAMRSISDPLPPADSLESYTTNAPRSQPAPGDRMPGDDRRELHNLYEFFRNLLPWTDQVGVDGLDDDGRPTEEYVNQRIAESGIAEEEIAERMRRMVELQDRIRMRGELVGVDGWSDDDDTGPEEAGDDGGDLQARVEDAEDDGH